MQRCRSMVRASILAITAMLAMAGCASRQPLGQVELTVDLDEEKYTALVDEHGSSAIDPFLVLGIGFGKGGQVAVGGGGGITIPLTNEVEIVGLDKDNLDRIAFRQKVTWGTRSYTVDVFAAESLVCIHGVGPKGRIRKYVGELRFAEPKARYEIVIREAQAPAP